MSSMKKFLGIKEKEKEREKEKEKESSRRKHHLHFQHSSTVQHAQQQSQRQQSQQQHAPRPTPTPPPQQPSSTPSPQPPQQPVQPRQPPVQPPVQQAPLQPSPPPAQLVVQQAPQVQLHPLINPPPPQRRPSLTPPTNVANRQGSINLETPLISNQNATASSLNLANLKNTNSKVARDSHEYSHNISTSDVQSTHESIVSTQSSASKLTNTLQSQSQLESATLQLKEVHQFQDYSLKQATEQSADSSSYLSSHSIDKDPIEADANVETSFSNVVNADSTVLEETFDATFDNNDDTPVPDTTIEALNKDVHPLFANPSSTLGLLPNTPMDTPETHSSSMFYDNSAYDSESNVQSNPHLKSQQSLTRSISSAQSLTHSQSQSQTDLHQPPLRRESVNSIASSSTNAGGENVDKTTSSDIKKVSRNIISKVASSNRSTYAPSIYSMDQSFISSNRPTAFSSGQSYMKNLTSSSSSASSGQYPIAALVKPEWDNYTEKAGWVNRIDSSDSRLLRLELKGTHLLVHKPQPEVAFAKNLIVNSKDSASPEIGLDNDFIKSKTDVSTKSKDGEPQEGKDTDPDATATLTNDDDHEDVEDNEDDANIEKHVEPMFHNDSILLSQAIDEYESKPSFHDDKGKQSLDPRDQMLELHSVEMDKRLSMKSSSQSKKHLPFIIHDLFYQSPSCPHPKLVFDMTSGLILRGTLEAVCHTILFYPSDRMSDKLVEILPLISSLIDPLVYFQKYLEHFTDSESLKKKSINITEMEVKMLFSRIKRIIDNFLDKFNGSLLDDEIFKLLVKLANTLAAKCGSYLPEAEVADLSKKIFASRGSLLKLISFELASPINDISTPIEIAKITNAELITGSEFITLSTEALAHEIHAIDAHFMKYWSPRSDRSTIFARIETIESSFQYWRFNPLQFIPAIHTHYLGRLITFHLFEDKSTCSTPEKRAQILMKWIHLGTTLCEQGDMVSWLGIAIVICSQPVLRLSETWGNVDKSYLHTIKKKWAPVVFEVRKNELFGTKYSADTQNHVSPDTSDDSSSVDSSKNDTSSNIRIMITNKVGELYAKEDAIPHFGELFTADTADIKNYNNVLTGFGTEATPLETKDLFKTDFIKYYCSYLEIVDWNLKQWDTYYDSIENNEDVKTRFTAESSSAPSMIHASEDSQISNILKLAITYNASNGPFPLNYFMSLSVLAEPPYVGQFARFHGTSRSPLFLGSYASILFPELLPYYGIYDRHELIGAIGGAGIIDLKEPGKRKNRNLSLKHVRDLFNAGCDEFRLDDGSVIFKTVEDASHKSLEEEDSKKSRPSSILFENPSIHKHMSTLSTGSFTLEDYITSYQSYLKDAIHDVPSSPTEEKRSGGVDASVKESTPVVSGDPSKSKRRVDIVTTAASTERLVDLLVLTSSVFGTHLRMSDVRKYSERTNTDGPILLQMDDAAFTCTFFATYRVFYTTKQLIDSLHKRFDGSKSAALSIAKFMNSHNSPSDVANFFPQWDSKVGDSTEAWSKINWKFVVQIQLGVIEATLILANDYFRHFMDDIVTKCAFDTFLEMVDMTIVSEWPKILKWLKANTSADELAGVVEVYKTLQSAYKQLRNICIRKSYTPQCELTELNFSNELKRIPEYMKLPASTDIDEISSFVNKLDDTIASAFSHVRSEDWIDTFEMIQMLITKSPLSMFNYSYQDSSTHTDLILISNIYNWITTLNDSENFSKSPSDKLINKLPPTIRSIFRLYERIQKYFLLQIVDGECSLDERIERMSSLLKIIQVCRVRMKNVKLFEEDLTASKSEPSPYLPSFIESIVVNTIMLPESRFFAHSWKLAAEVWKPESVEELSCEKLQDMLPKLTEYEVNAIETKSLSICPGWFLSRLVELACFIPNMDVDNTTLVNFDKNRFIYNCVLKIHKLQSAMSKSPSPYMSEFSFLFEFDGTIPSLKTIYQISSNERHNEKLEKSPIFSYHVQEQIQLIKLEQTKRDLLLRQREKQSLSVVDTIGKFTAHMTEPLAPEHAHSDVISIATSQITNDQSFMGNSSMLDSTSTYVESNSVLETSSITGSTIAEVGSQSAQSSSAQSIQSTQSSATLTRPSSSATSRGAGKPSQSDHYSGSHHQGSNNASKFKFGFFKSRPFSLNINNFNQPVAEKRSVYISELPIASNCVVKQKPYFTIMLKDVHIFPTYRTPNSFSIDVGTSSSNHEYTFQTADEKEIADWIYHLTYAKKHWFYSKLLNKQYSHNNYKLTFGAPLSFACERDGTPIPNIVEKILSEIELRGLEEVGIYRKSASLTVVTQIKDEVNKIGDFNMENSLVFDIHNLTGCIKAYLRELPEPLISDELVKEISAVREVAQDDARFQIYKNVLEKLPTCNYNMIERLSRHMKMIEEYKSQNRMTSYNLATIMGGSLVEGCRPETMRQAFGLMNFICEDWILHYERVFQ